MKPNGLGPKQLFLNPGASATFTTAELAAIDNALGEAVYPYAYTSTVSNSYDCMNVNLTGSSDLAAANQVSFGVFLSPENELGNFLFQVSGAYMGYVGKNCYVQWFFGRQDSTNTVTSSKAAPSNLLDKYIVLGSSILGSTSAYFPNSSIEKEIFSLGSTGKYNYCFGLTIGNTDGAVASTFHRFKASLAIRKYNSTMPAFQPTGGA